MESRKTNRGRESRGGGGGGGSWKKIPTLKARTRYRTFLPPSILNSVLTIGSRVTRRFFRHPLPPPRREILFIARDTASRRRQRRRRGKFAAARSSKRIAATKIKRARHAAACRSSDTFVLFPPRILRRPSGATGVKGPGTVERLDSQLRRGCLSRANRTEPPQPLITTLSSPSLSSSLPFYRYLFSNRASFSGVRERKLEKFEANGRDSRYGNKLDGPNTEARK